MISIFITASPRGFSDSPTAIYLRGQGIPSYHTLKRTCLRRNCRNGAFMHKAPNPRNKLKKFSLLK